MVVHCSCSSYQVFDWCEKTIPDIVRRDWGITWNYMELHHIEEMRIEGTMNEHETPSSIVPSKNIRSKKHSKDVQQSLD